MPYGSKEWITERKYWAQKKGQIALDAKNTALAQEGQPIKQTKFETDKAKLRQTIRKALSSAVSFEEFAALLLREGVTVKESRGRLSYLTPDRTKLITAYRLGDDFDKAALEQNTKQSIKDVRSQHLYAPKQGIALKLIDREAKRAKGKGIGYDRWADGYNLKQMATSVNLYQQYGFADFDKLEAAFAATQSEMQENLDKLKTLESTLAEKKELQKNLLSYIGTKPVRDGLKAQKSEKARQAYRKSHISDFLIAEAAVQYFREKGISKLPKRKHLQAEMQQLTTTKNTGYNKYRASRNSRNRSDKNRPKTIPNTEKGTGDILTLPLSP